MERNIPYVAVGVVVLLLLAGLAAFATWQAGRYQARGFEYYTIRFEGGVSGVSGGGTVRYRGAQVGRVVEVRLQEEAPESVRVDIMVQPTTPVSKDTVAQVLPQGITGVSYIELTTEEPGPPPEKPPGERYPVIPSKPSPLDRLMAELPKVGDQVGRIANRVEGLLSEEAVRDFQAILANTAELSGDLNQLSNRADRLMDQSSEVVEQTGNTMEQVDSAFASVDVAAGELRTTVERADSALTNLDAAAGEARTTFRATGELIPEAERTLIQVRSLSERLNRLVADNEDNVDRFASEGLEELSLFLGEGRRTLSDVRSLVRALERNPSQILYPPKEAGMEVPE